MRRLPPFEEKTRHQIRNARTEGAARQCDSTSCRRDRANDEGDVGVDRKVRLALC
jgi:hypothetical protein